MAGNNIELLDEDKKFTHKTVLYCIRGLVSAELASNHRLPKLNINDLIEQIEGRADLVALAKSCLVRKQQLAEKQEVAPNERIRTLYILHDYQYELEGRSVALSGKKDQLIQTLKDLNFKIKLEFYS